MSMRKGIPNGNHVHDPYWIIYGMIQKYVESIVTNQFIWELLCKMGRVGARSCDPCARGWPTGGDEGARGGDELEVEYHWGGRGGGDGHL
jgi:hypothetical protein